MAGADKKRRAVSKFAGNALDVVSAAADLTIPGAGLAIEAMKALGGRALGELFERDYNKREAQFYQVIFNAFAAIAANEPDVAAAEIGAHVGKPEFAASVRAAAAKLAESNPCNQALRPLGLLIAAYSEQRPDPLFRSTAGFLSDCSADELTAAEAIVCAVEGKYPAGEGYFRIQAAQVGIDIWWPPQLLPGQPLFPKTTVPGNNGPEVAILLLAHGLARTAAASGAPDHIHDPTFMKIDSKALYLLRKVLRQ